MTGPHRPKSKSVALRLRSLTEAPAAALTAPGLAKLPFNVRALAYLIASGHRRCWRCSGEVAVYALAVSPPFDSLNGSGQCQPGARLAVLSYVESMPGQIENYLMRIAPRYFYDESKWHRRPYWMKSL